ncbi:hypothetical protein SAMN04515674_103349 [Pseudarcicella hirudinis]|uniref:Uncharacterized protein n=1 Tax=Pseudarcicella hirudinis TaxID=1079859 RepID=A0A1I5QSP6_9BACT|nr:DUF6580 family putative transport protein [Pseudarcicella hirudinis]SFP49328.1 hypothetical protein SAMN04515674_103349 [Pseudarcicella hirudinis]
MKQTLNPRFLTLMCFILAVALVRIGNSAQISPISNFSPIGAMGLFGGAYFTSRWKAFAFPVLTLLISDVVINEVVFQGKYGILYSGWWWIYGIFLLIVLYGKVLLQKISVKNVILASLIAAISHWILADFSVWIGGGTDLRTNLPLSRDWAGLQQCLIQGFPFMKNFLAGTLVYSAIMFGAFELLKARYPKMDLA